MYRIHINLSNEKNKTEECIILSVHKALIYVKGEDLKVQESVVRKGQEEVKAFAKIKGLVVWFTVAQGVQSSATEIRVISGELCVQTWSTHLLLICRF